MLKILRSIIKNIIFCLSIIIVLICIFVAGVISIVGYSADKIDYCIEDGDCEEGRIINTPDGNITINKEICLKYKWKWNEQLKFCKVDYTIFD